MTEVRKLNVSVSAGGSYANRTKRLVNFENILERINKLQESDETKQALIKMLKKYPQGTYESLWANFDKYIVLAKKSANKSLNTNS